MKKQISIIFTFIIITLGCVGCISGIYNTPFINTDETTKLKFGMSKNDVIETLGKPLYVDSGGNDQVAYIYEVRTILVRSDPIDGTPNKFHQDQKHANPIHRLKLVFEENKLIYWGNYDGGDK